LRLAAAAAVPVNTHSGGLSPSSVDLLALGNTLGDKPEVMGMLHGNAQLSDLVDAAESAYRRARHEVYDTLPPGEPIDVSRLEPRQRYLLTKLSAAETALEHGRREIHGPFAGAC
jgi:hypothetical protein